MNPMIHVFRATAQPATRFTVAVDNHQFIMQCRRRALRTCFSCGKRRRAGNLYVRVYYDATYHYCKPGKGCKAK